MEEKTDKLISATDLSHREILQVLLPSEAVQAALMGLCFLAAYLLFEHVLDFSIGLFNVFSIACFSVAIAMFIFYGKNIGIIGRADYIKDRCIWPGDGVSKLQRFHWIMILSISLISPWAYLLGQTLSGPQGCDFRVWSFSPLGIALTFSSAFAFTWLLLHLYSKNGLRRKSSLEE